jgi:hypothetical protein
MPLKLAIQGLGAAGRARLQAISQVPGVELGAILSRRPEVATLALDKALLDPQIDALAISLENAAHPEAVSRALAAGKHVLCDYPLAFEEAQGRELFRRAREKNLILHVEHIGLLTQEHGALKKESQSKGAILKGEYLFQGGFKEMFYDEKIYGPLPFFALSRLMQVADLFGEFVIEDHRLIKDNSGFSLHLHLKFAGGGILGFTEERGTGLPRKRSLVAQCKSGNIHWKAGLGGGGLFAKDLAWFRDRVLKAKPCYYDEEMMLRLLGQLEAIS